MKEILYGDFDSEEKILLYFDKVFSSGRETGFIRATNFEKQKTLAKVFLDFFERGDISIAEADYIFNVNIDAMLPKSSRWEYVSDDFCKESEKNDILRKNVVCMLEGSEKEKYFLNLKVVNKRYILSETAGKLVIIGNADFCELLNLWERYRCVIDELLFFSETEEKSIFDIPNVQRFYKIKFSERRTEKYLKYKNESLKTAAEKLGELLETQK